MSQVIELKDDVFTKLKQTAERDGVTPEVWIEIKVKEISNGEKQLPEIKITGEERKKLQEFQERTKEKLGVMWKDKYKRQIKSFNERNTD